MTPPDRDDLLTHAAWARRLARALVSPSEADDLVQETWLQALLHRPALREPRAWLTTVMSNLGRSRFRSDRRRRAREEAHQRDPVATAEESLARVELRRTLAERVSALPEPLRQTVLLRYFDELSAAEIGRRLGIPAGTVRWRLKTALDRLRADLEHDAPGWRREWAVLVLPLARPLRLKAAVALAATFTVLAAGTHSLSRLPVDYPPPETLHLSATPALKAGAASPQPRAVASFSPQRYEGIPRMLVAAFLAAEDRDFYRHHGVDVGSLFRALVTNIASGGAREGGATITQQLARWSVGSQPSILRKLRELLLASEIERRYAKDQILALYLGRIYLGHGAFGVTAAAQRLLGKDLSALDVGDCALLAGLARSPVAASPLIHPEVARARRNQVLAAMVDTGAINQAEAARWMARP